MSINYIEIITKQDYKEYAPADNYTEAQITTAINMSFDLLDDYSGYLISQKWELESENGGFTDKQKYLIKKAFLIQTRYYLQCGLRRPQGQIQRTNGGTGININTPNRDELQKEAMRCLEAAGLTKTIWSKSALDCCDECIDISKYPKTNLVREMCLLTQYTPIEGAEHKKNKIVMYNNNCEAEWVDPSTIPSPAPIEKINLNGVEQAPTDKAVNINATTSLSNNGQSAIVDQNGNIDISGLIPTPQPEILIVETNYREYDVNQWPDISVEQFDQIMDYDKNVIIRATYIEDGITYKDDLYVIYKYKYKINPTLAENTAEFIVWGDDTSNIVYTKVGTEGNYSINVDVNRLQKTSSTTLTTTNKTIVGAINEVNTNITNSAIDIYNDMEEYVVDVVWGQPDGSTQLTLCIKSGNGENHQILQNALIYRHYFKCFVKIDRSYVCCTFTIDTNSPSKMNYQQVERWFFRSPFTQISGAAPNNLTNLYPVSGISSTIQVNTPNGTNYVGNVAVGIYAYIHNEGQFVLCDLYLAVNYGGYTMIDKSDAVVVNFATQNLITGEWVTYE